MLWIGAQEKKNMAQEQKDCVDYGAVCAEIAERCEKTNADFEEELYAYMWSIESKEEQRRFVETVYYDAGVYLQVSFQVSFQYI